MLSRLSTLSVLAIVSVAGSAAAQIPSRASTTTGPRPNAPLMLVATPYTTVADDSAAAVDAGIGLRERLRRNVGRDYNITTREKMNEQLGNSGYPADALLDQLSARTLASRGGASLLIFPTYQRVQGSHRLNARLTMIGATTGGAGHVVSMDLGSGESPRKLGERVADEMRQPLRAIAFARECYSNAANDQAKAIAAAERAIREVPNFAAAEYCWGEILRSRDSTSTEALAHYQNAVKSDPMSLEVYGKMGSIYHLRGDSANVISTYQTMLQVEPLDQVLRERAFQLFQIYGRPGAAEEVADAGIQRDPFNTDWYDLKSNACLMQEKYECAIDELERLWQVDSTRADSSFFSKITYATWNGSDTTRFVKWAVMGVERYPDHQEILDAATRAYALQGDADKAIDAVRRLVAINPYDLTPLLITANTLAEQGVPERVIDLVPTVKESGDEDAMNTIGQILVNAANSVAGQNLAKADSLSQAALDAGMTQEVLVTYANYFIGANMFDRVRTLSASVRQTRSCAEAREYQAVLTRAKPALEAASRSTNEQIRNFTASTIGPVNQELQAIPEMVAAFCN
jgi:tetratricopeptide (TPR) repeat protein